MERRLAVILLAGLDGDMRMADAVAARGQVG
jgi:hypothetical protein